MTRRIERVNVLLREEISRIVAADLRDPRLSQLITVTRVDTSRDLSQSWVYISVLGKQVHKDSTLKALKSASGFIHKALRDRLSLRTVPKVGFRIDESIERGDAMLRLIDEVAPGPETLEEPQEAEEPQERV
jgi:ribosome-binding factor A